MALSIPKTGERIIPEKFESQEEYLIYLGHLFTYELAQKNISPNSFVLDLGCGEGYGTGVLSRSVKEIVGLDVDAKTVEYATGKYGTKNCLFRAFDGKRIPYEDNTFDAIVSFQVIEHIRDDASYISEAHRVLKTGGMLMLATPNRAFRLKAGQKPWNRFHVREYLAIELENILKNKFTNVEILGIKGKEEVQKIERKRIDQSLRMVAIDPFGLRNAIPEKFKPLAIKIARKVLNGKRKNEDFMSKYKTSDFFATKDGIEESFDLFGICIK